LQLLALQHLGDVQIEEVAVQDRLNDASHNCDDIVEALEIVSVDPVENVKPSVRSQGKEIVRSDGFGLTGLLHHKQLRQNGNGLQVNGEGP